MSGSESWGQEEVAHSYIFRPIWPLSWVIYTDGSSKLLKFCSSANVTAIACYNICYDYHKIIPNQ